MTDRAAYLSRTMKSAIRYMQRSRLPKARSNRCVIVGMGPSLSKTLEQHGDLLASETVFAVNRFAETDAFVDCKPAHYCLIDPAFHCATVNSRFKEMQLALYEKFNNATDWKMDLFFPVWPNQIDIEATLTSSNLNFYMCNIVPGYTLPMLRNQIYRSGLLMPPAQNVMVTAIYLSINMGYREIYLVGADHSWMSDLFVGEDNLVYIKPTHFSGNSAPSPLQRHTTLGKPVAARLHDFGAIIHRAFRSYWLLEQYAKSRSVKILNATPGSFIDAFDRVGLENILERDPPE
jgi:hypothetical protein